MAAQTYNPSSNGNGLHRKRRPDYTANRIDDPSYIRILDTTLRDGEQSPGAAMTVDQKLDVARQLAKLGVDVIEAGFPAASPGDVEAVKLIAKEVGNCVDEDGYVPLICASARCNKTDIDAAWQAVRYAMRPRITTFIATSDIHLTHKLRKSREEVVNLAREMVTYARSIGCPDVEFCAEDAARYIHEFPHDACMLCERVDENGLITVWLLKTKSSAVSGPNGVLSTAFSCFHNRTFVYEST